MSSWNVSAYPTEGCVILGIVVDSAAAAAVARVTTVLVVFRLNFTHAFVFAEQQINAEEWIRQTGSYNTQRVSSCSWGWHCCRYGRWWCWLMANFRGIPGIRPTHEVKIRSEMGVWVKRGHLIIIHVRKTENIIVSFVLLLAEILLVE